MCERALISLYIGMYVRRYGGTVWCYYIGLLPNVTGCAARQLVNVLIVKLGNNSCGSHDNDFIEFDLLNLSST